MARMSLKRTVITLVIIISAATAAGFYYVSTLNTFEVDVTITYLEPATGKARVEYMHPRKDRLVETTVVIPEACELTLGGDPATIVDLRPGDTGRVRVEYIRKTKTINPIWVHMKRRIGTTRPADQPAVNDSEPGY